MRNISVNKNNKNLQAYDAQFLKSCGKTINHWALMKLNKDYR